MTTYRINPTTLIGFWIGISAWSISFITLIWAYVFFRLRTGPWLDAYITDHILAQAVINTFVLALSSWSFRRFYIRRGKLFLAIGFLLGLIFMWGQWSLWQSFLIQGLSFKGSLAGNFFYLLTGFHALHIAVAMAAFFYLRFDLVLKFWDLLLVFWLALFGLIFFLK